jgi:hypothetical protein
MDSRRWRRLVLSTWLEIVLCSHPAKAWKWKYRDLIFHSYFSRVFLREVWVSLYFMHCYFADDAKSIYEKQRAAVLVEDLVVPWDMTPMTNPMMTMTILAARKLLCSLSTPCLCVVLLFLVVINPVFSGEYLLVTSTNAGNCFSWYFSLPTRNWVTN